MRPHLLAWLVVIVAACVPPAPSGGDTDPADTDPADTLPADSDPAVDTDTDRPRPGDTDPADTDTDLPLPGDTDRPDSDVPVDTDAVDTDTDLPLPGDTDAAGDTDTDPPAPADSDAGTVLPDTDTGDTDTDAPADTLPPPDVDTDAGPPPEAACHDGHDDDQDGLVDCEDGDCVDACTEQDCRDRADDDGDGDVDCNDPDCWPEEGVCGRVVEILHAGGGQVRFRRNDPPICYSGHYSSADLQQVLHQMDVELTDVRLRVSRHDRHGTAVTCSGTAATMRLSRGRLLRFGLGTHRSSWTRVTTSPVGPAPCRADFRMQTPTWQSSSHSSWSVPQSTARSVAFDDPPLRASFGRSVEASWFRARLGPVVHRQGTSAALPGSSSGCWPFVDDRAPVVEASGALWLGWWR